MITISDRNELEQFNFCKFFSTTDYSDWTDTEKSV